MMNKTLKLDITTMSKKFHDSDMIPKKLLPNYYSIINDIYSNKIPDNYISFERFVNILNTLPANVLSALKIYYGLINGISLTQNETAKKMNVSVQRISQFVQRGIRVLRYRKKEYSYATFQEIEKIERTKAKAFLSLPTSITKNTSLNSIQVPWSKYDFEFRRMFNISSVGEYINYLCYHNPKHLKCFLNDVSRATKQIEGIELSARAYNALRRKGINKLKDLIKLSYDDILEIPNVGPKIANEIFDKIAELRKQKILKH